MCGIAGFVSVHGLDQDAASRAIRMRDIITHRGPDEEGLHVDAYAALAHRRLSIVDLSTGQQPASNEDGTVWIVFNGEIYNHADIRRELEVRGHRYRTRSDTETIVHAYEEWGDDCVHRFRGMFAFAIWDAPKRRLLLVRDRLGIKPLYWARIGDTLLFGSEIKALLASELIQPQPNTRVLPEVLSTRYTSGADTMFRGIHKLLPGHRLVYENGRIHVTQYWDIPTRSAKASTERGASADRDVVAQFRALLVESVRLRLMSDVPLAIGRCRPSPLRSKSARSTSSNTRAKWRRRSAPSVTRSSSTTRTSSARCRSWSGTRTSRSRIPRACRCTSCRRSRGSTSPSC
jgi:asparagine synthase (glutamine-hydrolysing)